MFTLTLRLPAPPSHTIRVERERDQIRRISLARKSDLPDRDVVLDIRRADARTIVLSGLDSKRDGRFAAVLPSTEFGTRPSGPRRLVILLDCSGSMSGIPISQAKEAIEACLGGLDEHDQFGLVTFSNRGGLSRSSRRRNCQEPSGSAQVPRSCNGRRRHGNGGGPGARR